MPILRVTFLKTQWQMAKTKHKPKQKNTQKNVQKAKKKPKKKDLQPKIN